LQNIIHPTSDRLAARFLSYNPSVVHIRVSAFKPSAIQDASVLVVWLLSMLSLIQLPTQVEIYFQKDRMVGVSAGNSDPSWNLFTLLDESTSTNVETPCGFLDGEISFLTS
jgi:hypothetical protein